MVDIKGSLLYVMFPPRSWGDIVMSIQGKGSIGFCMSVDKNGNIEIRNDRFDVLMKKNKYDMSIEGLKDKK